MTIIKRALTCVLNNMKQGKALSIIVIYITAKDTRVKKILLIISTHASILNNAYFIVLTAWRPDLRR